MLLHGYRMQRGLRDYAEYVKSRNEMADYMRVIDPRSEEEKINAADLHQLAQANNELVDYEKGSILLKSEFCNYRK